MGSQITLTPSKALVPLRPHALAPAKRQLDLVLDDARLEGVTATERHATLTALALLLLEAAGAVTREAGHDYE